MSAEQTMKPGESKVVGGGPVTIRVESADTTLRTSARRFLISLLIVSLLLNVILVYTISTDSADTSGGISVAHHSGKNQADAKLAVINFTGTIIPPFTERWLKQIEAATEDESVKGVLLAVDSPGGLVADSHQLYTKLQKLREKKPVYVAMKRLAASGGYYLSMGIGPKGKIFVEPTTWTGSIGVIIPRYNAAELAEKVGVTVEPLKTGPLKDALNPFRDLSDQEREVWDAILKESFDEFIDVIAENRSDLTEDDVRSLATGQIYTAKQAIRNGLVDEVGYEDDALEALAESLGLDEYEAITYSSPASLLDLLLSGKAESETSVVEQLLDASVPKAMYYCSWNPWVPTTVQ